MWGDTDGEDVKTCVKDIDGSLKAAYDAKQKKLKDAEDKKKQTKKDDDDDDVVQGDCPILYTECDFKGDATEVCKPIPHLEDSTIKSIYIPETFGKTVVLHKLTEFKGKTAKFKKSVKCLDDIDFHILANYGINVNFDSDEDRENFFKELGDPQNDGTFLQIEIEGADVDIEAVQVPIEKKLRKIKANK